MSCKYDVCISREKGRCLPNIKLTQEDRFMKYSCYICLRVDNSLSHLNAGNITLWVKFAEGNAVICFLVMQSSPNCIAY